MDTQKIIIYSALARLWGNSSSSRKPHGTLTENGSGKLSSWDKQALDYVKSLGCTHLWLIGIIEHATATSFDGIPADPQEIVKGIAGSPYAIKDYYDVSPELADRTSERRDEFIALIQRVHQAGLKLIIDFVPNHVARTYHSDVAPLGVRDLGEGDDDTLAFSPLNNFYYFPNQALSLPLTECSYQEFPAKATGNDCFSPYPSHNDWYETIKLNYGVDYLGGQTSFTNPIPATWLDMYEILRYWAGLGVDGFRCDMAEMVPPEFWAWALPKVKQEFSVFFLAEIYQPHRYSTYLESGFDYLYDKVGVYDTLRGIVKGELSADSFDKARMAVGDHQDKMCYFLENHDEQRFASPFYAGNTQALYPAITSLALSGSNPYLHYFAGELGERGMDAEGFSGLDGRTTIFDYWSLESLERLGADYQGKQLSAEESELLSLHRRILTLPKQWAVLTHGAYYGLNYLQGDGYNRHRVLSYLRYEYGSEWVLVVANFSSEAQATSIRFTEEIFKAIGLSPNVALKQENLLEQQSTITALSNYAPYQINLPAYGVSVLRLTLTDN